MQSVITLHVKSFMLLPKRETDMAQLWSPEVVVALTHQWGSLVAVTTMISSLKKVSCSELTALQSTKALTRF